MVKRHLILTWLIMATLLLPSAAPGALRELGSAPGAFHPTQGEARYQPLAPETLTWRQRTVEEWAASNFEHTGHTAGTGVTLFAAGFQQIHAGDFDDDMRSIGAMASLDADGDGDLDFVMATSDPNITIRLLLNDGHGRFAEVEDAALNNAVSVSYTHLTLPTSDLV